MSTAGEAATAAGTSILSLTSDADCCVRELDPVLTRNVKGFAGPGEGLAAWEASLAWLQKAIADNIVNSINALAFSWGLVGYA
jgi:hypothetical protein